MKQLFKAIALSFWFLFLAGCASDNVRSDYAAEIWSERAEKHKLFSKKGASPLSEAERKNFISLNYYEPDSLYRFEATVNLFDSLELISMATSSGKIRPYHKIAILTFSLVGESHQLIAYRSAEKPEEDWFIPFKDFTNGEATYGGGRYLDLNPERILDKPVVLDFNKAYNPYCHYSEGFSCPIPPKENELPVAIEAGEKRYR